ncbi:sieve element occlusion i, partial [Striga asiatica]
LKIKIFEAKFGEIISSDIDVIGTNEPTSLITCKISSEILTNCFDDDRNLHEKTLFLLEKLRPYSWDAKIVLTVTAFALNRTRLIIRFEGIYMQHELLDYTALDITKSKIYLATYWIFRSILCILRHSNKTVIAAWRLHTLRSKLNGLCRSLGEYIHKCQQKIETRLQDKLLHLFKENKKDDSQIALRTLFASQNFPFKNASSGQMFIKLCDIDELKNKVVILLISKPEFLPIDNIHFLANQIKDVCEYAKILWVPISTSREWTSAEKTTFELVSSYMPWLFSRSLRL